MCLPNFTIEIDAFFNFNSKLLNATNNDIGIGNINVGTAEQIYNLNSGFFDSKNWNYSDIIDYIASNEGAVHIATLVIKEAQNLLFEEIESYPMDIQEAVLITYYKQGDTYIKRFKANKDSKNIRPGEGCRTASQRQALIQKLYKL